MPLSALPFFSEQQLQLQAGQEKPEESVVLRS
jgi:hypothetical protein